ncbi:MAG: LysR family transcriptional regulator [Azospirillaceae bacterium]|nr:LysR family transcriptional regulator [Azospirillaceae bacterium]
MDSVAVAVFVNAASAGSLSAAARRLGISPMVATRRLAALEDELGVRLMHRTTRSVSLTPEGEAFLPFAFTVMEASEAGRAIVAPSIKGATGLLRVTACGSIGRTVIIPLMPKLLDENPGLKVDFLLTDTVVDIASTGIDVAIRIAELKDSTLVGSTLARNPRLLCASPNYLGRRGTPRCLADLADHDCVTTTGTMHFPFMTDGGERAVRIPARLTASSIEGVHEACLAGVGLAVLSTWHAKPDIEAGRLTPIVLQDGAPKELTITALFPTNRQVLPKVRVFLDMLRQVLAD